MMVFVTVSEVDVQHAQTALTLGHPDLPELFERGTETTNKPLLPWYYYTNRSGCLDLSKALDITSFTVLLNEES